jgi:hypothetical protein
MITVLLPSPRCAWKAWHALFTKGRPPLLLGFRPGLPNQQPRSFALCAVRSCVCLSGRGGAVALASEVPEGMRSFFCCAHGVECKFVCQPLILMALNGCRLRRRFSIVHLQARGNVFMQGLAVASHVCPLDPWVSRVRSATGPLDAQPRLLVSLRKVLACSFGEN